MEQLRERSPGFRRKCRGSGQEVKPYFTVRVNKWLFAVTLLIALVLLVRHFYLVVRVGIFFNCFDRYHGLCLFISLQNGDKTE